jgi:XTP/dITP diphosphohydrolase
MSKDRPVLVTQNRHKIVELKPLFQSRGVRFATTSIEKMEIRSERVEEIAIAAARHAFITLKRPVIVDDTGLYISALGGFPGAYAAFVLRSIGNDGILRLLKDKTDRTAVFRTAVGYCDEDHLESFAGEMKGSIAENPVGEGGFGYDPVFVPEGFQKTYAQLALEEKISISHRTRAFAAFLDWYTGLLGKS